jgi:hypothetical protein
VASIVSRPRSADPARARSILMINGRELPPGTGVDAAVCGIDDLIFSVRSGRVRCFETVRGRDLAAFGLVQISGYPRPTATLLSAIAAYLDANRRPLLGATGIGAPTKLYQSVRFAQEGLPVPVTVYLPRNLLAGSYTGLVRRLGLPFVLRSLNAIGERRNRLIGNADEFDRYVHGDGQARAILLAQEFIPNNGSLRMLVLGGELAVAVHRCDTGGPYLRAGHATLFEPADFGEDVKNLAVRSASLIGGEVAGAHLTQHRVTGGWYVLGASSSPAIGSGAFADRKLAAYSTYLRKRLAE